MKPHDPRVDLIAEAKQRIGETVPKVHRCWNCNKPIPLSALRCKHCGVAQRRADR